MESNDSVLKLILLYSITTPLSLLHYHYSTITTPLSLLHSITKYEYHSNTNNNQTPGLCILASSFFHMLSLN